MSMIKIANEILARISVDLTCRKRKYINELWNYMHAFVLVYHINVLEGFLYTFVYL